MSAYTYSTPSKITDFSQDSQKQDSLNKVWDLTLDSYSKAAIVSNPWNVDYQAPCDWYVDPTIITVPTSAYVEPVFWTAFPNRLKIYFAESEKSPYGFTDDQVFAIADYVELPPSPINVKQPPLSTDTGAGLPYYIPSIKCPLLNWDEPESTWRAYDPLGPRGWLDEYCEWAVTRNKEGKITKISFTCENPEYWFCLWSVDPERVLELYQELVNPNVIIEDLYLPSPDGTGYVIDTETGKAAYNPLNKWNSGTIATQNGGGAVHLTSPPNTIGAEIMLASQATLLREIEPVNYNMQNLVCKSEFGRPYRNSDPHIGLQANQVVKAGFKITLTNPIGLYIQRPNFTNYTTPDGTDASKFYKVIRGSIAGENGTTYDQVLHAEFSVPESYGYTISDITIGKEVVGSTQLPKPILYAGQVAETFHVCLAASAVEKVTVPQDNLPPVKDIDTDITPVHGQPSMLIPSDVLKGMVAFNPNSPFVQVPIMMKQDHQSSLLSLQVLYPNENYKDVEIYFCDCDGNEDEQINVKITSVETSEGTPVGSSSNGSNLYNYQLKLTVSAISTLGLKGVIVKNPKSEMALIAYPGMINIIA
jgi:hypothetical protein